VATVPLLWIIPLSLYLVSFIVAFDHPRWYSRTFHCVATVLVLLLVANYEDSLDHLSTALNFLGGYSGDEAFKLWRSMPLYCIVAFAGLFLVCLVCHCELAALKPPPRHLTAFFLTMSAGGALGGIFCNLVAPYIFVTFFELPLAILAAVAVAFVFLLMAARQWRWPGAMPVVAVAGAAALLLVAYGQIGLPQGNDPQADRIVLHRARNFYGLVSVEHRSRNEPEYTNFAFRSGHIIHGRQYADPARRNDTNIAYWGPGTGSRKAMEHVAKRPGCRIGIVGLGIGTLAGFAKPDDYVRMYEINPEVVAIAKQYFHFLADCPAKQDIVLGDARLQLERELRDTGSHQFDVLCLDAFSGDAVPTHLLTDEAFALYKQHLADDGIIVVNITNTYLDLYPVVKKLAEKHGLKHTRVFSPGSGGLTYRTYFVLLTNDESFLLATPETIAELPESFRKQRDVPLWTDRYHNLFQVLQ
ncbi:MAG: fused MFS/spermidine synthase, partial [Pirellulaceae bacterium]|nr:fused MFS/spermidine synthase [Pirellulaceae bacterium]